jgi:hypothetical protein
VLLDFFQQFDPPALEKGLAVFIQPQRRGEFDIPIRVFRHPFFPFGIALYSILHNARRAKKCVLSPKQSRLPITSKSNYRASSAPLRETAVFKRFCNYAPRYQIASSPNGFVGDPVGNLDSGQKHAGMTAQGRPSATIMRRSSWFRRGAE